MGTALLVGIPEGYVGDARSAIDREPSMFSGWSVKCVPSAARQPQILTAQIRRALVVASQYQDTHVLGFSAQDDRRHFAEQIKVYFRFRWFDHTLLKYLKRPDCSPFLTQLAADLAEESAWAGRVKPAGLASPLLLPACSFGAAGKHRDLWRHACSYGDLNNINGAEKAITAFRGRYLQKINSGRFQEKSKWLDEQNKVFDRDGPRHGAAAFPRDWKYSFKIESGFHFDVTSLSGKKFALYDAEGEPNHVVAGSYINVDPHGCVI